MRYKIYIKGDEGDEGDPVLWLKKMYKFTQNYKSNGNPCHRLTLAFSLKLTMCMTFGDIIPPDHPRLFHGFIYRITIGDKWYLGMKSFNKGEKWQTYKSSSKDVKELLKSNYGTFEILEYCKSQGELNYKESKWLFKTDALEDPKCLNKNIAGRYFRKNVSKY